MNNLLIVFIVVTAVAVSIQAGILVGLFLTVRKSAEKMEALATDITSKTLPKMESVLAMMVELRPKIEVLTENVSESSTLVRNQLGRIDATLTDALDRTRLQVIRADELLNRTMDRIEETSDAVHRTVISPVRQLSGVIQGLTAGLEFLLGGERRRRHDVSVPQDEMFI